MFKEHKSSPYAKMFLVTPVIYEKLKKCINKDDINLVNKKTQEENLEEPKNMADQVIQDIANEEIGPQDDPITAVDDNSYEPVIETERNLPGPSSRSHHMFTDSNVISDNINIPVNPPVYRNGNYYVNPGDYDVNWAEVPPNTPKPKNQDANIQTDRMFKPKTSNTGVQVNQFKPKTSNAGIQVNQFKPHTSNIGTQANQYIPQRHMGTQHIPDNSAKFTQTDMDNGAYFVRKPALTYEKSSCSKDPLLPLSKCKPKLNTQRNINENQSISKPKVTYVADNSTEAIQDILNIYLKNIFVPIVRKVLNESGL
jgi:hypothetical protein